MKNFINTSIIEKLPEDHFGTITSEVLHNLTTGQCASIYGIPGYGMDYFAKHIIVRLQVNSPQIKTILLNLELDNDKNALLTEQLKSFLKTNLIDELSLSTYLQNNKIIVVLNKVYHPDHKSLFKFLNALREINTQNFTVLTVGSFSLLKDSSEYFSQAPSLFTPLRHIPNFNLQGVRRIMRINNKEYHWNIPMYLSKKIYELSGGNPALVKYICTIINYEGEDILDYPRKLKDYQPLNYRLSEITKIITELTIEEQLQMGLIDRNGKLFSKLLNYYLAEYEITELSTLLPNLTKTDRKILTILIQNKGRIINKDQLSLILDQTTETYSEWAIYKAVARVREKVKAHYQIKTLRGAGWRLE